MINAVRFENSLYDHISRAKMAKPEAKVTEKKVQAIDQNPIKEDTKLDQRRKESMALDNQIIFNNLMNRITFLNPADAELIKTRLEAVQ